MIRNNNVIIPVILYKILIATAVVGAGPPSFAVVDAGGVVLEPLLRTVAVRGLIVPVMLTMFIASICEIMVNIVVKVYPLVSSQDWSVVV